MQSWLPNKCTPYAKCFHNCHTCRSPLISRLPGALQSRMLGLSSGTVAGSNEARCDAGRVAAVLAMSSGQSSGRDAGRAMGSSCIPQDQFRA